MESDAPCTPGFSATAPQRLLPVLSVSISTILLSIALPTASLTSTMSGFVDRLRKLSGRLSEDTNTSPTAGVSSPKANPWRGVFDPKSVS